jgi:hypothetical protein
MSDLVRDAVPKTPPLGRSQTTDFMDPPKSDCESLKSDVLWKERAEILTRTSQRIGSISLMGLTFRPCASFTMLSKLTFLSPRSTPPT